MPPKDKANINLLKSSYLPFKIVIFVIKNDVEIDIKKLQRIDRTE